MSTMSFARFMVFMATFNEERTLSRPFSRFEFVCMVETEGSCKSTTWSAGFVKAPKSPWRLATALP
jgi:hypothetical protein